MINDKKNDRVKVANKEFYTLHEIPEVDQFLDKGKEYFKKKYNIDYFSVHMIHHTRSNFIGFLDHDEWHAWDYKHHGGITAKGEFFDRVRNIIQPEEVYLEYFGTYMKTREVNVRAEIVGIRKYGGCTIVMSDKLNNITQYDITFKDDSAFGTLDKKVLYDLTKDLIRYKSLLLPFIDHVDQFNDFSDKAILHKSMDKFMKENSSLFYF